MCDRPVTPGGRPPAITRAAVGRAIVAAVIAVGAVTWSAQALVSYASLPRQPVTLLDSRGVVLQRGKNDCGIAAAMTLAAYRGHGASSTGQPADVWGVDRPLSMAEVRRVGWAHRALRQRSRSLPSSTPGNSNMEWPKANHRDERVRCD